MKTKITGTVTALDPRTDDGIVKTNKVSFFADSNDAWIDIVDRAFGLAFRADYWEMEGEDLFEEEMGK